MHCPGWAFIEDRAWCVRLRSLDQGNQPITGSINTYTMLQRKHGAPVACIGGRGGAPRRILPPLVPWHVSIRRGRPAERRAASHVSTIGSYPCMLQGRPSPLPFSMLVPCASSGQTVGGGWALPWALLHVLFSLPVAFQQGVAGPGACTYVLNPPTRACKQWCRGLCNFAGHFTQTDRCTLSSGTADSVATDVCVCA